VGARRATRPVSPDCLAKYFGTSAEFWVNLQARHDVLAAERALAKELDRIEPRERAA
jgi:plasmid maintenance system antidote protein VapI